jgi:RNA methyltransferase, TrmH family
MNIIEIESKESKKLKDLNKLKLKKYRERQGEFTVENWKIIQDALADGIAFKELFVTRSFLEKNNPALEEIFNENNIENLFVIADKLGNNLSSLKAPQGVWAVYKILEKEIDFNQSSVYLNNINDPGNLGTILRSALAFGLENIILDEECVDIYNPKTIQAAKDAIFKLNIAFDKNREAVGALKQENIKIYATDVTRGIALRDAFKSDEKVCIVLGNESHGVESGLLEMADNLINIKTTSKIESLNVAISGSIIFYEFFNTKTK